MSTPENKLRNPGASCLNCPSYLSPSQSVGQFKKSIGVPMCARFGHVLGREEASERQAQAIATTFAQDCEGFGLPKPPMPKDHKLQVALPHPDTIGKSSQDFPESVTTCSNCFFYIKPQDVENQFGWSAAMCAAKGKLLLPTRLIKEAADCDRRSLRDPHVSPVRWVDEMTLLPVYSDAFALSTDPIQQYFANNKELPDPATYPTDKEVTVDDAAAGIRAWRAVYDPDGGAGVGYLPIYSPDLFTDAEKEKIPRTGDDSHPEQYLDHGGFTYMLTIAWTELDETPSLWGQGGTGKTELLRHMAWLMQLPFERISIKETTELDDIEGKTLYDPERGTYYQYGRLPKAWTRPCVICVDEPNVGPPAVWHFLRPLTDNSKQLVIDANDGEHLQRHDDCYLGLAMNPAWDPLNVSANQISDPDATRLFHVRVQLPPKQVEEEIIRNACLNDGWEIDEKRLSAIMGIAADIRALCDDGTLQMSWGIRVQKKVARASRWFSMLTAYRAACADYLEPEQAEAVLDVVKAHSR